MNRCKPGLPPDGPPQLALAPPTTACAPRQGHLARCALPLALWGLTGLAAQAQNLTQEQLEAQIQAQIQSQRLPQAGVRPFPATARRGYLELKNPPYALMDGKEERLSPGARIRDANNLTVMSGPLIGQSVLVNYVRNAQGDLHEVWILNRLEAREERPGSAPRVNYSSGVGTDTVKRDDGKTPFDQLPKFKN